MYNLIICNEERRVTLESKLRTEKQRGMRSAARSGQWCDAVESATENSGTELRDKYNLSSNRYTRRRLKRCRRCSLLQALGVTYQDTEAGESVQTQARDESTISEGARVKPVRRLLPA